MLVWCGGSEKAHATVAMAAQLSRTCPYIVGVEVSGNPVVRARCSGWRPLPTGRWLTCFTLADV